ncbi:hypothetical protein COX69_04465 [Candidatus Falkowbacteria bacterium CG_4_10_14_0_2_um_filter_48_10]|uniref:Glutamine--fructose-6-phosphate aminotransferase [isomerizing] n=1 Tax=Candidatus Falkowbacteria bacterium CG23_combo_of_CG06-09_8_20_14_all_49_15 TaxID=1974572 RepID=A0A2G9ZLD4_9BACT|nr:MAG: hypothetical protein COX22_01850 [Candidatus Falkowbacteria bacterium CG23_combo_of_CG06-09_8_20_14_all_49_15]PJA07548.1 MAG: hypothetical protein COX69_04465 [Candidatus Falkowbacteria bacterium CG_4_10_14_0_2_um_filter_48_10]
MKKYKFFMRGQKTLEDIARGSAIVAKILAADKDLANWAEHFQRVDKIYALGCGSSYWLAFLVAAFFRRAGRDATAVPASEFFLTGYPVPRRTLALVFSQSGETTETVRAAAQAREQGAAVFAVINRGAGALAKMADGFFLTPAGSEQILATKSFAAGLAAAYLFAHYLTGARPDDLSGLPVLYEKILALDIKPLVRCLAPAVRAYSLGIGLDYGLAGEAALKLGEGAGLQITALPALEISHGYKANLDGVPVLVVGLQTAYHKVYENLIREIRQAGARIISFSPLNLPLAADCNVEIPGPGDTAIFTAVKLLQRLAVETALARGLDPDQPAGLAKTVRRVNF